MQGQLLFFSGLCSRLGKSVIKAAQQMAVSFVHNMIEACSAYVADIAT
jgi:hypothetical protein